MTTNSVCAGSGGAGSSNGLTYQSVTGYGQGSISIESDFAVTVKSAATFSNLGVNIRAQLAAITTNYRVGAANGNQAAVQSSSGNGWVADTTHSDSATSGNSIDLSTGNSSAVTTIRGFAMQENAISPNVLYGIGKGGGATFATSTGYSGIIGGNSGATTSNTASNQTRIEDAGTLSNYGLNIFTTQPSAGTVTAGLYNGGVTGSAVLSVSASGTGFFQDTTHTDSILSGTDCSNYFSSTNASGSWGVFTYQFVGATSAHDIGASWDNSFNGDPVFVPLCASGDLGLTTESQAQTTQYFSTVASLLRVRGETSATPTTTATSRIAAAPGNQTATLTASLGPVVDSTHTDSLTSSSLYNAQNSGSQNISSILMSMNDGSIGGAKFPSLTTTGSGP